MDDRERLRESLVDLERARRREALLRRESDMLLRGLQRLAVAESTDDVFVAVAESVSADLGFDVALALTERRPGELSTTFSTVHQLRDTVWPVGPLFSRVMAGNPAVVFDLARVEEFSGVKGWLTEDGGACRSALLVPLIGGGRGDGVFVFAHNDRGFYTNSHRKMATRLAPLVSQALVGLELRRATSERDRLFGLALDMICTCDIDGRLRQLNPSWERVLGYSRDELRARPLFSLVHEEDRAEFVERIATLSMTGEQASFVARFLARDGQFRWLLWSAQALPDEALVYAVVRDESERMKAEVRLRHLAEHDPLTGLPNRAQFMARFRRILGRVRIDGGRAALLFLDLDRFKPINDELGHDIGDQMLIEVARRITDAVRPLDGIGRLGGDEFVVTLPGVRGGRDAITVARRLVEAISAPVELAGGHRRSVGVSVGVALYPDHGLEPDGLLRAADGAMYRAKETRDGVALAAHDERRS